MKAERRIINPGCHNEPHIVRCGALMFLPPPLGGLTDRGYSGVRLVKGSTNKQAMGNWET